MRKTKSKPAPLTPKGAGTPASASTQGEPYVSGILQQCTPHKSQIMPAPPASSEDPISFAGGLNFYPYVGSSPTTWIDPLGLKMSKDECAKLLGQIARKFALLSKEIAKYNPVLDAQGGFPWSHGGSTGVTKPGGHYNKILDLQRGLGNDIKQYVRECFGDDNPPVPPCVLELQRKQVPVPVLAPQSGPTQFELDQLELAARYKYYMWLAIVQGGAIALGAATAGATAPSLGPVGVLVWATP